MKRKYKLYYVVTAFDNNIWFSPKFGWLHINDIIVIQRDISIGYKSSITCRTKESAIRNIISLLKITGSVILYKYYKKKKNYLTKEYIYENPKNDKLY